MKRLSKIPAVLLAALLTAPGLLTLAAAEAAAEATFKPEELEQLAAPIALYPDSLLAQVFMASTYPLEVVEAARWQKANSSLKDKALEDALQGQSWDPSVKSLTAFPPVLTMMNDKLDWTQKLGDAFLAQQSELMDAVQRLRNKAHESGNLESNEQQKVIVEQAPANVQQNVTVEAAPAPPPMVIQIEPAQPQVVYVPTYNPTTAYGSWPYPTYPPYSYYPPGYVAATSIVSFGVGMAVGAALWGDCNWGGGYGSGHNDVDIDVNNYNNFNKTDISNKKWEHNSEHRKGVQYRDQASRQKYNRGNDKGAQSREAFRGRAEQGRKDIARGDANEFKNKPADRGRQQGADRGRQQGTDRGRQQGAAQKPAAGNRQSAANRPQPKQSQRATSQRSAGAYQGMGNGKQTRADSNRGHSSRQSASRGGGGGNRGGGSRGGGGGGRGGGGRGGGGGRR